jgi:hypothetical protein
MVTAMTAEATATRVVIRNPGGSVAKTIRGDFYGSDRGVDLSAVDVALDGSGYVQGTWRWNEGGSYWKAVVSPESAFPRAKPYYSDEEWAAFQRTPEGQRQAASLARLRARQGR